MSRLLYIQGVSLCWLRILRRVLRELPIASIQLHILTFGMSSAAWSMVLLGKQMPQIATKPAQVTTKRYVVGQQDFLSTRERSLSQTPTRSSMATSRWAVEKTTSPTVCSATSPRCPVARPICRSQHALQHVLREGTPWLDSSGEGVRDTAKLQFVVLTKNKSAGVTTTMS